MRNDILLKKNDIIKWIKEHRSKAYIYKELNCKPSTLEFYLKKLGLEYSGNKGNSGYKQSKTRLSAYELASKIYVSSYKLKLRMLQDKIVEYKCNRCLLTIWREKPIPLELHHKDGNRFNNDFSNLELLCCNCHGQEPNNSGKASSLSWKNKNKLL